MRPAASGAALVEQHDAVAARVKQQAHPRRAARSRAAVQHQRRLAGRVAAGLPVQPLAVAGIEHAVRRPARCSPRLHSLSGELLHAVERPLARHPETACHARDPRSTTAGGRQAASARAAHPRPAPAGRRGGGRALRRGLGRAVHPARQRARPGARRARPRRSRKRPTPRPSPTTAPTTAGATAAPTTAGATAAPTNRGATRRRAPVLRARRRHDGAVVSPPRESRRRFDCFGGPPRCSSAAAALRPPAAAACHCRAASTPGRRRPSRRCSRTGCCAACTRGSRASIRPRELSQLNAAPEPVVYASRLLRALARAVVEAGERSGGLVDATLVDELERAGYRASRAGRPGLDPSDVLEGGWPARPARPRDDARVAADRRRRRRAHDHPAAVAADRQRRHRQGPRRRPRRRHAARAPGLRRRLLRRRAHRRPRAACRAACSSSTRPAATRSTSSTIVDGAVATSGVTRRSWRDGSGAVKHHLLDPFTGQPAWTGVVQATALAPTALEAEILAKAALLAGPTAGASCCASTAASSCSTTAASTSSTREPAVRAA